MDAKVVYSVHEIPVTDEDRKRYGWGEHIQQVYWLVRHTQVYVGDTYRGETWPERAAWFNFDSEAAVFKAYLEDLQQRAEVGT